MVIFKKTAYVETHELGIADTLLQIGVTWCLSLFMFCGIEYLKKNENSEESSFRNWKYII